MDKIEVDVAVIGAGVIGLAVAAELPPGLSTVLVEAHDRFGCETSSRNSEVIHAGIHYPVGSRKTEWCIAGRDRLYAFCEKRNVPFARVGKLTVAVDTAEEERLAKLEAHARSLGVACRRLSTAEIEKEEPLVAVKSALLFADSGIIDSHSLMAELERAAIARGTMFAYRHRVLRVEPGWKLIVASPDGEMAIEARTVVNAAGLGAAALSNLALSTKKWEHRLCRGRYYTLSSRFRGKFRRLVYPMPVKDGLGIHVTLDLDGNARLGPNVEWCQGDVAAIYRGEPGDWDKWRKPFLDAYRHYGREGEEKDLTPSQVGIRPKLFIDGVATPDFLVEATRGWVHCLGIESPGLTSSLIIAEEARRWI